MKQLLTTCLLALFSIHLFGQVNFSVEDSTVKTGSIIKYYNFYYQLQDSISLFFSDSTITYANPLKTIVKQIAYSSTDKKTSTRIEYFGVNGEDSISKHFSEDKLSLLYTKRFDNLDRIFYYGMKDFDADSTYDRGFEWAYEYRDSLIRKGKIVIQTVFDVNKKGEKDFKFRILSEYDKKKRKVKETRETQTNDPYAQIATYKYDDKGNLIEERLDGAIVILPSKHKNTLCDKEIESVFTISKFDDYKELIQQLLNENKTILNSDKCENIIYSYISLDKQMKLIIRKIQPYWEGGRNVSIITTKNY